MSQFLRPDSDVTATRLFGTSGSRYLAIDETSATSGGGEQIDTNPLSAGQAVYRCGLSNPTYGPSLGTSTVRFQAKGNASSAVSLTVKLYERAPIGSTLIATDTPRTLTTSFANYSFTPNVTGVTDWTQVELEFVFAALTGNPAGSLSWAEMEIPNPGYVLSGGSFALSGGTIMSAPLTFINLAGGAFSMVGGTLSLVEKAFKFFARGRDIRSSSRRNSVRSRR